MGKEPFVFSYTDENVKPCKDCGVDIYFVRKAGTADDDKKWVVVTYDIKTAHFLTCPASAKYRKQEGIE